MKWFFALNGKTSTFDAYSQMVKVAVDTAREHTHLDPHFVFDGEENELTRWLRGRGVKVIRHRSFLYEALAELARTRNDPNILSIGAGAFLRNEIPQLTHTLGIRDRHVLYTDCDVMFVRDVEEVLRSCKPRWFAVVPEDLSQPRLINSGVMVMNVKSLRSIDRRFRAYTLLNLPSFVGNGWDQDAYREYFADDLRGRFRFWERKRRPAWDRLPAEMNWRPYWGESRAACIIHFHGPKPQHRDALFAEDVAPGLAPLVGLRGGAYSSMVDLWESHLRKASVEAC